MLPDSSNWAATLVSQWTMTKSFATSCCRMFAEEVFIFTDVRYPPHWVPLEDLAKSMLQACEVVRRCNSTAQGNMTSAGLSVRSTTTRTSHAAFFSCDSHSHLAVGTLVNVCSAKLFSASFGGVLCRLVGRLCSAGEFGLLVVPLRRCVLLLQL